MTTKELIDNIVTWIKNYASHSGMKSLISDEDTMKSVSLSCPQSRIMKKEVFLFEVLHSRFVKSKVIISSLMYF